MAELVMISTNSAVDKWHNVLPLFDQDLLQPPALHHESQRQNHRKRIQTLVLTWNAKFYPPRRWARITFGVQLVWQLLIPAKPCLRRFEVMLALMEFNEPWLSVGGSQSSAMIRERPEPPRPVSNSAAGADFAVIYPPLGDYRKTISGCTRCLNGETAGPCFNDKQKTDIRTIV